MQNLINKPREIKDECEIKKIAEAEKIGDMAFEYVLGRIKEGVTEREIALDLEFFYENKVRLHCRLTLFPHRVFVRQCRTA